MDDLDPVSADFTAGGVRFQIYPRKRQRRLSHLLCYYVGSRRVQTTIKGDRAAAERQAKILARQVTGGEIIDALHMTALDRRVYITAKHTVAPLGRNVDAVCREFMEAQRVLGSEVSLLEIAREWKQRQGADLIRASVGDVAGKLLAATEAKRSTVTSNALKVILKKFKNSFQVPICEITAAQIQRWLDSMPNLAPRTLNNHRAAVVRLFNYAKKHRYVARTYKTEADLVEQNRDTRGAVEIYQPWELTKLLTLAPDHLRPCLALGAFAGLRTAELCRLDWSAVNWDEAGDFKHGFIEVSRSAAKQHRTAARRLVPIQENLAAWLEPFRFSGKGKVSRYKDPRSLCRAISTLTKRINTLEHKARRPEISRPANGLRHSYGSYRLPVIKSAAALALEMNNSEQEIFENYRELVMPDRAPDYWQIQPTPGAKIIQLDWLEEAAE